MARLEGPRSAYIAALSGFYNEFSSILDFFSPEAGSAQDSELQREPQSGPDFAGTTLPKLGLLNNLDCFLADPLPALQAGRDAGTVLAKPARRAARRLRRALAAVPAAEDQDAAIHEARKAAKRAGTPQERRCPAGRLRADGGPARRLGRDARGKLRSSQPEGRPADVLHPQAPPKARLRPDPGQWRRRLTLLARARPGLRDALAAGLPGR